MNKVFFLIFASVNSNFLDKISCEKIVINVIKSIKNNSLKVNVTVLKLKYKFLNAFVSSKTFKCTYDFKFNSLQKIMMKMGSPFPKSTVCVCLIAKFIGTDKYFNYTFDSRSPKQSSQRTRFKKQNLFQEGSVAAS